MTQTALDRVVLAAPVVGHFNTDVVRSAWDRVCSRRRQARRAARQALEQAGAVASYGSLEEEDDPLFYSYIKQLWTDHIIVTGGSDRDLFKVPYSVLDPGSTTDSVEFGTPVRVVETYVAAARELDLGLVHLSAEELSRRWEALVTLSGPLVVLAGPPVAERRRLAKEGKALEDGSYPISSVAYLKKAIRALGRAKDYDRALRLIKKRARELGRLDLVRHLSPKGSS